MTDNTDRPISQVGNRVMGRNVALQLEVEPAMRALYQQLSEWMAGISGPTRSAPLVYSIPVLGNLKTDRIEAPSLMIDSDSAPREIIFNFKRCGREGLKATPANSDLYFDTRKQLFDYHLKFRAGIAATVGKITVEPEVPVELVFTVDEDNVAVVLSALNFFSLGTMNYTFRPSKIDDQLMRALILAIENKSNDFFVLASESNTRRRKK